MSHRTPAPHRRPFGARTGALLARLSLTLAFAGMCAASAFAAQRATSGDQLPTDPFVAAAKVMDASGTLPSFVQFSPTVQPTFDVFASDFLASLPLSADHSFRLMASESDALGENHYRLAQLYRGVRVLGADYVVHERNGAVRAANGALVGDLNLDPNPTLAEDGALTRALAHFGAARYMWEDAWWTNDLRARKGADATWFPEGELVWAPVTFGAPGGASRYVLAWQFDIHAASPTTSKRLVVDARTGALLAELALESNCVASSVNTIFNGNRNISTDKYTATNFRLRDDCAAGVIRIRDWNSATLTAAPIEIENTTNTWTTMNERFGASVLWEARQSHDYFLNTFGRNSYDGAGGDTEGYINAVFDCSPPAGCTSVNNASMSFSGTTMKVGLGSSGTLANSWSTLDIIAHEYAHAVTGNSAALVYMNESGALNESFSDIFGEVIENWVTGTNDWRMGQQRTSGAIRSLQNPNLFNDPDTYLGTNWFTGTGDNGGVHTNSGVQNFWFYLLCAGGSGTNDNGWAYSVPAIGMTKAAAIAYRNLTVYLGANSTYNDARTGSIAAAGDLYGAGSAEQNAVIKAWRAVGIDPCQITCPANVVASNSAGQCGANVNYAAPTNNGMCFTVTTSPASGTFFPVGSTTVTATSTSGATCSFSVTVNDTEDPQITFCPSAISVECSQTGGTPKSDAAITAFLAAFAATDNCPGVVKTNNAPNFFPHGVTPVTFTATDVTGNDVTCTRNVTIVDTTPPSLSCPSMLVIECNSHCDPSIGGVPATDPTVAAWLASFSATDICDPSLVTSLPYPACFPLGDTQVTFTATDDDGNSSQCTRTVRVQDTTPPNITLALDRTTLWPPNHKLVTINATVVVTDICDPNPYFHLISVTSDEPDNGLGDGDTANDIQGVALNTGDTQFQLRSERQGGGDGRVYTIRYRAFDDAGNTTDAVATVKVPHNQSGNAMVAGGGGLNTEGNGFDPGAETFTLVIRTLLGSTADPEGGTPIRGGGASNDVIAFDAQTVDVSNVLLGNLAGELRPLEIGLMDADGDGHNDVVGVFRVAEAQAIAAASAADDGPVGLYYALTTGTDFLVDDILALGAPLAGIDLSGLAVQTTVRTAEGGVGGVRGSREPETGIRSQATEPVVASPAPVLEAAGTSVTGITSVHPVPMRGRAVVTFGLAREQSVDLAVYDVRGARLRTLQSGALAAGRHQVSWDGLDDTGAKLRSGVYFIRMSAGAYVGARKTILMP